MRTQIILLLIPLLLAGCDVFPTKQTKKSEENQKWFDTFYGKSDTKKDSYCSFYGTCKKKTEESSWDWWTGGSSAD